MLFLAIPLLWAQESPEETRQLVRNTLADAIEVPLVEDLYFGSGPYGRRANSLQIQPVLPLDISDSFHLVTRIVATPLAYLPDATQPGGGTVALGDTTVSFFLTPANSRKLVWGIGPALLVPTATSTDAGGGKWDWGPSLVLVTEPHWGSAGALIQNVWSFSGNSRRSSANQLQIETSFTYNLPHDWYLLTAPTISADWTQTAGNRWLVPFGGGAGRTFNIRHQAVDSNVALYYSLVRPTSSPAPKWQLNLQLTLVYPRQRKSKSP